MSGVGIFHWLVMYISRDENYYVHDRARYIYHLATILGGANHVCSVEGGFSNIYGQVAARFMLDHTILSYILASKSSFVRVCMEMPISHSNPHSYLCVMYEGNALRATALLNPLQRAIFQEALIRPIRKWDESQKTQHQPINRNPY
jgi:hypothetical protein